MKLLQRLFLMLIAVNLLMLLWSVIKPSVGSQLQQGRDRSVASLLHIREQPEAMLARGLPALGGDAGASLSCLKRGPFPNAQDAHEAMLDLSINYSVEILRVANQEFPLYRVMIVPSASLAEAQRQLADVRAAIERIGGGIDTYLVTSGPIANAVSLGLFSEQSNAINVQTLLAGAGIDVVVETEFRAEEAHWVITADPKAIDIIDESTGGEAFEVVSPELSENVCEMIAQAQ